MHSILGVVVIGRNEGDRLRSCLESVALSGSMVVYVDSGSTDGSLALAKAFGAKVVELDMSRPFTAARARNEGWKALLQLNPEVKFVQFLDGDCTLVSGWMQLAHCFLKENNEYAVVSGRLRERFPGDSIYNQLCDLEWDTPLGDVKACGGIAMIRMPALIESTGFRDTLIAGEEPELCLRLRNLGWKVYRLDHDMAWHDAAISRFSQWWIRAVRAGHAFAEGAWLHGASPERHWVKEVTRAIIWGAAFPVSLLLMSLMFGPWFLCLLVIYPFQVLRLARGPGGWMRAFFLVIGKFAEAVGVLKFYKSLLLRQRRFLIEYK